ncbi:MAG: PKD domain-containing protein [Chloroherpetonaceae bacterium]|nr:PKD domain-containing protein [Chthonomonadaceae bacterium]MDW8208616.1 PKD domain-containing protein [Chloroherpetonaceae bacterium]
MTGFAMYRGIPGRLWPLVAVIVLSLVAPIRAGQNTGAPIYRGGPAQESGIQLASWGSGTVVEDPQRPYSGSRSLRVTTHGSYQGARMILNAPINLGAYTANKNAYLHFVFQIGDNQQNSGFGGSGFPRGGFGDAGGSPSIPGGGSAFNPFRAGYGGAMGSRATLQKSQNIERIRLVLVTTDDRQLELLAQTEYAPALDQQWKQFAVPVSAIQGLKPGSDQIKEIRIFGDTAGTIYLGQMRVVTEVTPLTVSTISDRIVTRNSRNAYTARASAGVIPLKFSWDFDESDGIQEEKVGRNVTHVYHKSGQYVATLTVSDLYGILPPKTVKFKVTVTL